MDAISLLPLLLIVGHFFLFCHVWDRLKLESYDDSEDLFSETVPSAQTWVIFTADDLVVRPDSQRGLDSGPMIHGWMPLNNA